MFGELAINSSYLFQKKDRTLSTLVGEKKGSSRIAVAYFIMFFAALSGCTGLGPNSVRHGRPAYNDAILATGDGQLLQNIARMRFVDSVGFLAVSSITSNVSVSARANVDIGVGPSSNYAGNLTPFRGTLMTEQNPTISYAPVHGEHLLRQFAAEIPLEKVILILRGARDHGQAWRMIVRRVNKMLNPDFPEPPTMVVDPHFDEVVLVASDLQNRGSLYWGRFAGAKVEYGFILHSYAPSHTPEVARLLELLGIKKPADEGEDVIVPVQLSVGTPTPGTISIESRSVIDLMRLAAAGIELPADIPGAAHLPKAGPAGRGIRIHSSTTAPYDSRVATQYRGRWYYIDNDDEQSKQWFTMLNLLVDAQLPDISAGGVPVLTVPVGGKR